jgi:hypothetical protein
MDRTTQDVESFDPVATVEEYRRIIARRDDPKTPESHREDLQAIARHLRARWAEWCGEDSLGEMAFGEPINGRPAARGPLSFHRLTQGR